MWKFKSPYVAFDRYLKKNYPQTAPNKVVVWVCWVLVLIGIIIAFITML